jgi:hypothetical protein
MRAPSVDRLAGAALVLGIVIALVRRWSVARCRQNRNWPGVVVYFTLGGFQAPSDRS